MAIDFTADEPWTWEDRDFGLLVFHAAAETGPVKYRHRFEPRERDIQVLAAGRTLVINNDGLMRTTYGGRTERVKFRDLAEIRVKFEASGIWAPASILVLAEPRELAVFPLDGSDDVERCREELLPHLRRLPGWKGDADAALDDACKYALRQEMGPAPGESLKSRAERSIWLTPDASRNSSR